MDPTCIHSTNETNSISINYDDNFSMKYYAPFLWSNNHECVSAGTEYDSTKQIFFLHKNVILGFN